MHLVSWYHIILSRATTTRVQKQEMKNSSRRLGAFFFRSAPVASRLFLFSFPSSLCLLLLCLLVPLLSKLSIHRCVYQQRRLRRRQRRRRRTTTTTTQERRSSRSTRPRAREREREKKRKRRSAQPFRNCRPRSRGVMIDDFGRFSERKRRKKEERTTTLPPKERERVTLCAQREKKPESRGFVLVFFKPCCCCCCCCCCVLLFVLFLRRIPGVKIKKLFFFSSFVCDFFSQKC